MPDSLRDQFLLDPEVTFLNGGGLGVCPQPVLEAYHRLQREMERHPARFFANANELRSRARQVVGAYINAAPTEIAFVTNATTGFNIVVRSLKLQSGDEILATDHEYGSMNRAWQYVCEKTGARYIQHPIPLPVTSAENVVESLWDAVTPRTRVIFMSHITSPTALILPVAEIARRARAAGILTIVDGAHVPGQLPLDLQALGVDFYVGNFHKWLCAPKGTAFLYARAQYHDLVEPLVISGAWTAESSFISRLEWPGTHDGCAFLVVPEAIVFQQAHDWDAVRQRGHALASDARRRLADLTGLPPIAPDSPAWFAQMVAAPLPPCDCTQVARRLYEEHHVEVLVAPWNGAGFIRVSCQAYNTQADIDRMIAALADVLAR